MMSASADGLIARLEALLGRGAVSYAPALTIHGARAVAEVSPTDEAQVGALLRIAGEEGLSVCVAGGATKLEWGDPPRRFDLLLRTGALQSTTQLDADDLCVSASAGITVASLAATAGAAGRVLPLDVACLERATLGGTVATAVQGPRSPAYGRVKDLVLGLRAVLPDGTSARFGGRTMKNVAGYDMTRLLTGSYGALGVITEVTLRLLPTPQQQAVLVAGLPSLERAREVADRLLGSHLEPAVLELVTAEASPLTLVVAFAGTDALVARSLAETRRYLGDAETHVAEAGEAGRIGDAERLLAGITRGATGDPGGPGIGDSARVALRALLPLRATWHVLGVALDAAERWGLRVEHSLGVLRGVLELTAERPGYDRADGDDTDLALWAEQVCAAAAAGGGALVTEGFLHCSPILGSAWSGMDTSAALMRALKHRFDPCQVLNPGRGFGGV